MLTDVIDTAQTSADRKGLTLINTVALESTVLASTQLLRQVLSNLLENAIRYTPTNGHIRMGAVEDNGGIRIEVEDDGPGIAEEHRERVFERFYRVDPGRSRAEGGTGLGLSIVKHCVSSMGGTTGVAASKTGGALFWVHLPKTSPSIRAPAVSDAPPFLVQ